ncbi:patatin-like phospholipase family protein [Saccharospirillum sp. MSK14-1]|uniref:patatin-like phospholipase family protein n=1 Tax=Saccharospirillum sp. MSK14-1 TaxID=1897632 RepID=UPI001304E50F|nr:patatin-like phospholipase family protein [Saccharospirillum sp. MSK14-1]
MPTQVKTWLIAILTLVITTTTQAETVNSQRPSIALVLAGGGARGLSHIGVLRTLEELRVPVDCVVGTSMGALVGGLYSVGMNSAEISAILDEHSLVEFFNERPPRQSIQQSLRAYSYRSLFGFSLDTQYGIPAPSTGIASGYRFELFMKELIGTGYAVVDLDFDTLPTPFRAVATDLETGEERVFSEGNLPQAMRASMSLPALIAPLTIEGRHYVDGGLVQNFPVAAGRDLCGDVVIGVSLRIKDKWDTQYDSSFDVANRSVEILMDQNVMQSQQLLSDQDILVEPDMQKFTSADFDRYIDIINQGEIATRLHHSDLVNLALSPEEYQQWQQQRQSRRRDNIHITRITTAADLAFNDQVIMRDITANGGENFDIVQLHDNISNIYGRGDYTYVGYQVRTYDSDDYGTVEIYADSKPEGHGYLRFGLDVATDDSRQAEINASASYRQPWLNDHNGELRLDVRLGTDFLLRGEFIQPLSLTDGSFIATHLSSSRYFNEIYVGNTRAGNTRLTTSEVGFDLGVSGARGEIRLGTFATDVAGKHDLGLLNEVVESGIEPFERFQAGYRFNAIYDQLDSFGYPTQGLLFRLDAFETIKDWGSDDDYTKISAKMIKPFSLGSHHLKFQFEAGNTFGDNTEDLYFYDGFKLGGPGRLSGLSLNQLTGLEYQLATAEYYYRLSDMPDFFGRGLFLGTSVETGRIEDELMIEPGEWVTSGSLFAGMDTVLGKMQLTLGHASLDRTAFYFTIGHRF